MSRRQAFNEGDITQVLRLEVAMPTSGLPNLLLNHSGEKGAWGWETPVPSSAMTSSAGALKFTAPAGAAWFVSELAKITPGRYVSSRLTLTSLSAGHRIRIRYEWHNAAREVLSSSVQSGAASTTGVATYGPTAQAPAGAAFVRVRVDVTDATGGHPSSAVSLTFRESMLTHSATGTPTQQRTNLIPNPSFETNTAGWVLSSGFQRVTSGEHYVGSAHLRWTGWRGERANMVVGQIPVTGGRTYRFAAHRMGNQASVALRIEFFTADDEQIGANATDAWADVPATYQLQSTQRTAPSKATSAFVVVSILSKHETGRVDLDAFSMEETLTPQPYFDGATPDTPGVEYAWTGTPHNSPSTRTTTTGATFDFEEPNSWRNILGPSHEIKIQREALNVGTLTATVLDAWLDPATADLILPGKAVRLRSLVDGRWESVYEGRLTEAKVAYRKPKGGSSTEKGAVRIEVTATDNVAHLSSQGEERSVATIAELPHLLEGKGAPWSVNGSGSQATGEPAVVATNTAASVLDQVAITRDTVLGYAWVDRANVLQVWGKTQLSTTPALTLSDAAAAPYSYIDIDVSYDVQDCINSVMVNFLRYKPTYGDTEEIPYGPFEDRESIEKHGAREATFTIVGATESKAAVDDYANAVLEANATPEVRCNSVTMPVRNDAELQAATRVDLYAMLNVQYAEQAHTGLRVTGIEHSITPTSWLVTYSFARAESVAPPTWTPSPPVADGPTVRVDEVKEDVNTLRDDMDEALAAVEGDFTSVYDQIANGDSANAQAIAGAVADFVAGLATKSKHTLSADPPGTTANNAGDVWEQHKASDVTKIIGRWRGMGGTVWRVMDLDATYIPALDIGTGTFGDLDGNRITARTMGVEKLIVADFENLIVDPRFELDGWHNPSLGAAATFYSAESGATLPPGMTAPARIARWYTSSGDNRIEQKTSATVTPGEKLDVRFWGWALAGASAGAVFIYLRFLSSDGSQVGIGNAHSLASDLTSWTQVVDEVTVPPNAATVRISIVNQGVNANVLVTTPQVRRKNAGELIVDGTVRAHHLAADSITGLLVTGAAIQTNDNGPPPWGTNARGIKISQSGISGYSPTGQATFVLSALDGRAHLTGGVSTGTGYDDVTITPGNAVTPSSLEFWSDGPSYDNSAGNRAGFSCFDVVEDDMEHFYVRMHGPKSTTKGVRPRIDMMAVVDSSGGVRADNAYHAGADPQGDTRGRHFFYVDGHVIAHVSRRGLTMSGNGPYTGARIGVGVDAAAVPEHGITALGSIKTSGRMDVDTGFFDQSVAIGANAAWKGSAATWNTNGRLVGSGSSERFKQDIEALPLETAKLALDLESVTFRYRPEQYMGDDLVPGFIAEQADAIGLGLWVHYDPQGRPSGFRYAELVSAHNALLRDLYARIEALETTNA